MSRSRLSDLARLYSHPLSRCRLRQSKPASSFRSRQRRGLDRRPQRPKSSHSRPAASSPKPSSADTTRRKDGSDALLELAGFTDSDHCAGNRALAGGLARAIQSDYSRAAFVAGPQHQVSYAITRCDRHRRDHQCRPERLYGTILTVPVLLV